MNRFELRIMRKRCTKFNLQNTFSGLILTKTQGDDDMTQKKEANVLAKKITVWLNNENEMKELDDDIDLAKKAGKEFKKACRYDQHLLLIPFGPINGSGTWSHQRI
jgi:hypothetical protein